MEVAASRPAIPPGYWAVSIAGLAWNIFGVAQFMGQIGQSETSMMRTGMTAEQAAVMSAVPAWMDAAFAAGTIGGTIGCLLLLIRRRLAVPVFAASLAGYLALFAGDIVHGVFAALGSGQVAILTSVVAIAVALLWFARRSANQGRLG